MIWNRQKIRIILSEILRRWGVEAYSCYVTSRPLHQNRRVQCHRHGPVKENVREKKDLCWCWCHVSRTHILVIIWDAQHTGSKHGKITFTPWVILHGKLILTIASISKKSVLIDFLISIRATFGVQQRVLWGVRIPDRVGVGNISTEESCHWTLEISSNACKAN